MIYIRLLSFSVFESERERFVHDIRLRRLSVCKSVRRMRARARLSACSLFCRALTVRIISSYISFHLLHLPLCVEKYAFNEEIIFYLHIEQNTSREAHTAIVNDKKNSFNGFT